MHLIRKWLCGCEGHAGNLLGSHMNISASQDVLYCRHLGAVGCSLTEDEESLRVVRNHTNKKSR